jgi:hypothetical protein
MEALDREAVEVVLPGGYEREDGGWQRTAWLRPWRGHDEMLAWERVPALSPAAWASALLARCVAVEGGSRPASAGFVRRLTVGDREALLLHLRRITLGERLPCVVVCPACKQKMDLDLEAGALLLPPYPYEGRSHRTTISGDGETYEVVFRLPDGADQEWAVPFVGRDEERAALMVLQRCVQSVAREDGKPVDGLPRAVAERLPRIMADLDPQAELVLDVSCPHCGGPVRLCFDTGQYLRREIAQSGAGLIRQVHLLASRYHWSEAEILNLTAGRRSRYVEALAEPPPGRRPR